MRKRRKNTMRWDNWDYRMSGYYFITICTKDREMFFGEIRNGIVCLNELGSIAHKFWQDIPVHFPLTKTDQFIVMPNHVHGIIGLTMAHERKYYLGLSDADLPSGEFHEIPLTVGNRSTMNHGRQFSKPKKGTVSSIIGRFKSAVSRYAHLELSIHHFKWQRSMHDHIIKDKTALANIRHYIQHNPANWAEDRFYA